MTDIIHSLADISGDYDAVLCDLWGVYHNGVRPHVEAVEALRAYRARGGVVALLTNAPRPDFAVAKLLETMGAPEDSYDLIVTSGDATLLTLKDGQFGEACYHIGKPQDRDLFDGLGIRQKPLGDADFILCSGLTDDANETPEDYADMIAEAVGRGLILVCANPDIVVDRGERRLYCAGALAQAYAAAGGAVRLYGKPHRPVYDLAVSKLAAQMGRQLDPARILAIGDGPATDIKGANDYGIDALFIAAGLAAAELLDADGAIIPGAMTAYLERENAAPQKALAFLR